MSADGPILARTKPVSPSKLAMYALCPLRYVCETEQPAMARLPSGPRTIKGIVVHEVVEACQGTRRLAGLALKDELCNRISYWISRGEGGAVARYALSEGGVHGVIPRSEVITACQFVAKVLDSYGSYMPAHDRAPAQARPRSAKRYLGTEVWLEDTDLDVAGKADLVYRGLDGKVRIVDFKTARQITSVELGERHMLQLLVYALLVERRTGEKCSKVELVAPDGRLELSIDDRHRGWAMDAITAVTSGLPRLLSLQASSLAAPGEYCSWCRYRVSCPAYTCMLTGKGGILMASGGYDLIGTIMSMSASGGTVSLEMKGLGGTYCRLDGIPPQILPDVALGRSISAFNVRSRERVLHSRVPANFFVYRRDDPTASAFGAYLRSS